MSAPLLEPAPPVLLTVREVRATLQADALVVAFHVEGDDVHVIKWHARDPVRSDISRIGRRSVCPSRHPRRFVHHVPSGLLGLFDGYHGRRVTPPHDRRRTWRTWPAGQFGPATDIVALLSPATATPPRNLTTAASLLQAQHLDSRFHGGGAEIGGPSSASP